MHGSQRKNARRADIVLLEVFAQSRIPCLATPVVDDNGFLICVYPAGWSLVRLEIREVNFIVPPRRVEHAPLYRLRGRVKKDDQHVIERDKALQLLGKPLTKRLDVAVPGNRR